MIFVQATLRNILCKHFDFKVEDEIYSWSSRIQTILGFFIPNFSDDFLLYFLQKNLSGGGEIQVVAEDLYNTFFSTFLLFS